MFLGQYEFDDKFHCFSCNLHAISSFIQGNEPYEIWEKFKDSRQSPEYKAFKEERAACLWNAVEKQIPGAVLTTLLVLIRYFNPEIIVSRQHTNSQFLMLI